MSENVGSAINLGMFYTLLLSTFLGVVVGGHFMARHFCAVAASHAVPSPVDRVRGAIPNRISFFNLRSLLSSSLSKQFGGHGSDGIFKLASDLLFFWVL